MFGYVIVAVMLLFVGAVVDNVIVGFVIFTVVIVFVADTAYPFPNTSFTWVLTWYSVFNVRFVNVCVPLLSVTHEPQLLSDFFFIEYCLVLAFIPLFASVWADVTTIEFVVLVAVGAVVFGAVLSK